MKGIDPNMYARIKEDLWNEFLKGQKKDTKTITDAYRQQTRYWIHRKKIQDNKSEGGL